VLQANLRLLLCCKQTCCWLIRGFRGLLWLLLDGRLRLQSVQLLLLRMLVGTLFLLLVVSVCQSREVRPDAAAHNTQQFHRLEAQQQLQDTEVCFLRWL
jgi:hypothetical protein